MRIQIVSLDKTYRNLQIYPSIHKRNEIVMKYNRIPRRSLNDYTPEEIMKKATGLDSLLPMA